MPPQVESSTKGNPFEQHASCGRCRFLLDLIALGQGLRCDKANNREPSGHRPTIPGRDHWCPFFEAAD